jgi:hypothetical protein
MGTTVPCKRTCEPLPVGAGIDSTTSWSLGPNLLHHIILAYETFSTWQNILLSLNAIPLETID